MGITLDELAAWGLPVFPVVANGKHPIFPSTHSKGDPRRGACKGECGSPGHGAWDGTTNLPRIQAWAAMHPGCNWAFHPGAAGILVVDLDVRTYVDKNGATVRKIGDLVWQDHCLREGFERTFTVRTPSGGWHLWYRLPDGLTITTRALLGQDIDVRSTGGYALLPGSFVNDGEVSGYYRVVDDSPIAPLPTWIDQLYRDDAAARKSSQASAPPSGPIAPLEEVRARLEAIRDEIAELPEGDGANGASRLAFLAGQYCGAGQADPEATTALLQSGIEGWSWREPRDQHSVERQIAKGVQDGMREPRAWTKSERVAWDGISDPLDPDGLYGNAPRVSTPPPPSAAAAGQILPSPKTPLPVARVLADELGGRALWWRGDWYAWVGTHWVRREDAAVRKWIYERTEGASYVEASPKGAIQRLSWNPNLNKVNEVMSALGTAVLQRAYETEPERAIACTNGVVDLATGGLVAHDPTRFNLACLPYAYDPRARCPQWLRFLTEVIGEQERVTLQQWFGYVLAGDTDQHKMLSMIGDKRSGKGTVGRILSHLLGPEQVASPQLERLGSQFGASNLIGKSLAVMGDVRWNSRAAGDAVPLLLGITGEDPIDIDRKHREAWHGTLPTRFMMMSNDEPTFTDASGALANRMIHILFPNSFLGRENVHLTRDLRSELPGILNWAIEGLVAYRSAGVLSTPDASKSVTASVHRAASDVSAFVDDHCELAPDASVDLDELYLRYSRWCDEEGTRVRPKKWFSRDLNSALRGKVSVDRRRVAGDRRRVVAGLALRPECPCPNGHHGVHAESCPVGRKLSSWTGHRTLKAVPTAPESIGTADPLVGTAN